LIEVDGLVLADSFAETAFLGFEVGTTVIYVRHQGDRLSEVDVDRFVCGYVLIELVWMSDGAVFHTGGATGALALVDVSGLCDQGYAEVAHLTFQTNHFSIGEDLDVWVPADLDQFRGKYSHGAVIGGKGLVELGHVAADGWQFLHQVDPETRVGEIERGLDPADPSANNHDVAKISPFGTP
jgi:hypothetical protein